MDPSVKTKENTNSSVTIPVIAGICSSDSFSMFPSHHHDLTSTNSIELNAAASLSDDSGVPLTTNSSISSGDSYRLGLCKFDIEIVESDGEVSQFDSLDNCSEGGMSAENFNTLKKGPLAPIDPPPEFQDSPQTTLVRSMAKNPVTSLRRWTSSQSSFEHLKDHSSADTTNLNIAVIANSNMCVENVFEAGNYMLSDDIPEKDIYNINKHLYSSDSILNSHKDNIYDEPNNMLSSSLGNSVDILDSDSQSQSIPPPPPPVSIVKIKQTLCPYFQDHTRYFKAIPSEQDNITSAVQRFNVSGLSEIHDYDLYYGIKRNGYQQYDNSLQRKIIYSPLSNSHYCHNHVYHGGGKGSNNAYEKEQIKFSSSWPKILKILQKNIILDSDSQSQSIPPPPPPVSIVKIKQTLCPYFQDHTRYFKAIPSEQDNITSAVQRFNVSGLSEIHDYDLYYGIKRNGYQQYDNSLQRKIIYSPLSNSHYCHNHVYHGGGKGSNNAYEKEQIKFSSSWPKILKILQKNIILDSDSQSQSIPPPPPPVSIVKIKQTLCPYFQDHTRYFKAIPSEQDNITSAVQRFNVSGLSEIHDYDLYYGIKRNGYQQYDNSLQRKIIYSPLSNSHYCHNHVYHGGLCSNRPNSRNSLNSRLSSSHNSLSVSSANKPDDSIFITQAMSHDALLTREISDFYNVPIDSDIYALPVDMINSEKERSQNVHRHSAHSSAEANGSECKDVIISSSCSKHTFMKCQHQTKANRKHKNKRKKKSTLNCPENGESSDHAPSHVSTSISSRYNSTFVSTSSIHDDTSVNNGEPLHMSLEEVKQFYHTLYSETKDNKVDGAAASIGPQSHSKTLIISSSNSKVSNDTAWSGSRGSNLTLSQSRIEKVHGSNTKCSVLTQKTFSSDSETHTNNNNNNMISINNQNNQKQNMSHNFNIITSTEKEHPTEMTQSILKTNVISSNEKKSQFTLNLKQRFCSIFRFRKNNSRCSQKSDSNDHDDHITSNEKSTATKSNEDKRKKFQSRALPPLPKKESGEENSNKHEEIANGKEEKKPEPRSFHFTSSIEKVKDYGWYWGPLSSEAAEKVLSNEPDGSFIVRDSSDDHYIFSLSFKLNNCVRHVRIEQDQGTFSFGSYAKFKSQTITEFIEKAVEHSRSGRYLFFLHRRPEHGPMRVQLTNPVSRFKHVQSLQHMCRFVILKAVIRKDLIQTLPLPRRLLDYLNYKHCYSEQIESDSSNSQISGEGSL